MAIMVGASRLEPDNLAFVFETEIGVSATELGLFLQRASTVSRSAGVNLFVVGLNEGSLSVVTRAFRKGAEAALLASKEELRTSPVRTSGAAIGVVAVAVAAIAHAMTPGPGTVSPLARAGATLIENRTVVQISLVTVQEATVVMDQRRAGEVRIFDVKRSPAPQPSSEVRRLMSSATRGDLSGTVVLVDGERHFRPDGYRYLSQSQNPTALIFLTYGPVSTLSSGANSSSAITNQTFSSSETRA
jgi:hypothetical protein